MLEKQQRMEKHLDISNGKKEAIATLSLKAHEKEGQRRRLLNRGVAVDYHSQGQNAAIQEETKTQSQPLSFLALHLLLVLHRGWTRLETSRWGAWVTPFMLVRPLWHRAGQKMDLGDSKWRAASTAPR